MGCKEAEKDKHQERCKALMKMRKNLRKEMKQSRDIKERQHLKDRIRIIKEHKVDRNKESRGKKVNKIAEQIRSNITNDKNLGSIE